MALRASAERIRAKGDMARRLKADRVLFITAFLLVCTSLVMVYSATGADSGADGFATVIKQTLAAALGIALLGIATRIDYRTYRTDAFAWAGVVVTGVLLVMVLFSEPINGSRRWLNLFGLSAQPSELAKFVCVIFTALVLERRMHRINEIGYSVPQIAIVVGVLVGLIAVERDLGTAVSVVLIVAVMVFAAGLRYQYMAGMALVVAAAIALTILVTGYQGDRWKAYWHGGGKAGYQVTQSKLAVASGGVLGRGFGVGRQKLGFLPEPSNDFIFSVIAEELGLIGATGVLLCFCAIAWRGLRIASRAEESFGAFVAIGLTTMICAQAFVNMSVVLNLLPTKGIPLPLVSAGGSSLVVSLLGVGVLLNISQHEIAEA
jgi:cell division protein FtsW